MKNIKLNETKIKETLKKGIALTTIAFTLASFSGCSKKPSDYPEGYKYISQDSNSFDSYCKTIIRDGKPVIAYKSENISFTINKNTLEVKKYIYDVTDISSDVYDFDTGYKIVGASIFKLFSLKKDMNNWEEISSNNYIVDLFDIGAYIEGIELKDYYTLDELKDIEQKLVDAMKIVSEYDKVNRKVK